MSAVHTSADWLVLVFFIGLAGTAYAYVGFPLLLRLLSIRRGPGSHGRTGAARPVVTVLIPAYNEERSLEAKIRNVLDTEYPRELLDVLVISDGSTDRTNEIARGFEPHGVRLIVQETRQGKSAGLNRAIALARGEIVVFTDANAMYPGDAIPALVRYFDNPRVGLVTGSTRYTVDGDGSVAELTNAYTGLERRIKRAESLWGCCVGADGAIFALRRALYRPLRHDDINDFVIPLSVIDQGYHCLFAHDAFCAERPGQGLESEFRRQSRITNRTLRAIWRHAHLLNPLRFPVFAFFLFSHKVARFLVPILLVTSGAALALLALQSAAFLAGALAALVALLTSVLVPFSRWIAATEVLPARVLRLLSAFVTINAAVLGGWWRFFTGRTDVTWQHDRSAA